MNILNDFSERSSPDFLYSVPLGAERALELGQPHYSWRIACNLFLAMFEARGIRGKLLANPQIYDHPVSIDAISARTGPPLHLIFRPFDQIRILKSGYNVGCIVWEFDQLTVEAKGQHPFSNQVRMLSALDEIWTASDSSRSVFEAAGIRNVHTIPAPIESQNKSPQTDRGGLKLLAFAPSVALNVSHFRSNEQNISINREAMRPVFRQPAFEDLKRKKVFVTVLNPGDDRKNIGAMLKGFAALHAKDPNAVLIVKCSVSAADDKLECVQNDTIKPKIENFGSIKCDGIILLASHLSAEQMAELYSLADFYLCTSRCEGQNLPLLEAMSYGVVPVSVDHTAMADYINEANSFVIPSMKTEVALKNATAHWRPGLHWFEASEWNVFSAAYRACQVTERELKEKRLLAWRTVDRQYSERAVFEKVFARIDTLNRLGRIGGGESGESIQNLS